MEGSNTWMLLSALCTANPVPSVRSYVIMCFFCTLYRGKYLQCQLGNTTLCPSPLDCPSESQKPSQNYRKIKVFVLIDCPVISKFLALLPFLDLSSLCCPVGRQGLQNCHLLLVCHCFLHLFLILSPDNYMQVVLATVCVVAYLGLFI